LLWLSFGSERVALFNEFVSGVHGDIYGY
jgi:hypothetical protein